MMTTNEPNKFCCRQCQAELGLTDGLRLFVAAVILEGRISLRCANCQKVTVWYPPKNASQQKAFVQTAACANL